MAIVCLRLFLQAALQLNFIVHLNFVLLICLPTNRFLFVFFLYFVR